MFVNAFSFNVSVQWCMIGAGRIFYKKKLSKIFSAGDFVKSGQDTVLVERNGEHLHFAILFAALLSKYRISLASFLKQWEIAMPAVYPLIEAEINRTIT